MIFLRPENKYSSTGQQTNNIHKTGIGSHDTIPLLEMIPLYKFNKHKNLPH